MNPANNQTTEYFPRYTTGGETTRDAQGNYIGSDGLNYGSWNPGGSSESIPVKSEDQIQQEMLRGAQAEINGLKDYENSLLAEQKVINDKNDRSTAAISTLSGLGGSTEADVQQQKTTKVGQDANNRIKAEVNTKIQSILSDVRRSAIEEARNQRLEARQAEQDRIANRAKFAEEANTHVKNLAASGATFDGYKKTDPTGFAYLVKQFGGEDALKGAFVLNTPQDQVIDKRIENGSYVIARMNPLSGKISIETTKLDVPPGYSKVSDAGNRLIAFPDNWDGDPSKLRVINKGIDPAKSTSLSGVYKPGDNPSVDGWVTQIHSGLAKISNVPKNLQNQVVQALSSTTGANLSQAQQNTLEANKLVSELLISPGLKSGTGGSAWLANIPTTDARTFKNKVDRLRSLLSLNAIQQMRGLGALSDAEGKRIENSVAVLSDPYISEADYKSELERLQETLQATSAQFSLVESSAGTKVRVRINATGQTGTVDASEFDPNTMTKI